MFGFISKYRSCFMVWTLAWVAVLAATAVPALAGYELSLRATSDGSTEKTAFGRGEALYLDIRINDASAVAGCAFTLNYPAGLLAPPETDTNGLPINSDGIASDFPLIWVNPTNWDDVDTHRANSADSGKIYLAGATIDSTTGGDRYGDQQTRTLFTLKFTVQNLAAIEDFQFTLTQTAIFNPEAGYGVDANGNGTYDAGVDQTGKVPILTGAAAHGENGFDNFNCDAPPCAFPTLMADTDASLAVLNLAVSDGDSDGDGLADSVETDTGVYVGATNTGTDPYSADTDEDGLPDTWEIAKGTDPSNEDADADPDGDGLTNLEEYQQGSNPLNGEPAAPVPAAPADGNTGVSLQPTLTTGPFADTDGDSHATTQWQISTVFGSFIASDLVYDKTSTTNLTAITVPQFILKPGTNYYWRVRFVDGRGEPSQWSAFPLFTTESSDADLDANGVDDNFEVDASVDLDGDGTADVQQADIKATRSAVSTGLNIAVKKTANVSSVDALSVSDPADIADTTGKPDQMPMGLVSFKITVPGAGDTAQVTVYFSQAIPDGASWFKYDPAGGWQDFSAQAAFSADRYSVVLTLVDGGAGDADGAANGVIIDPSGPALAASSTPAASGGGGGGGGCFIATAAFGSLLEPHVKILRQFRDVYLLPTRLGSAFVRAYYRYSPPLARTIADHQALRAAVRVSLLPVVAMAYLSLTAGPGSVLLPLALGLILAGGLLAARTRRQRQERR